MRVLRMEQLSARVTFGPIPNAEELQRYAQVQADLPERIMRQYERRMELAERQSEHRMGLEKRVVGNNVWMERLGWGSATVIALTVLVGSMVLIYLDKPVGGIVGLISSLTAFLGLYLWSRKDQIQDIAKKRAADIVQSGATPEQLELLPERTDEE